MGSWGPQRWDSNHHELGYTTLVVSPKHEIWCWMEHPRFFSLFITSTFCPFARFLLHGLERCWTFFMMFPIHVVVWICWRATRHAVPNFTIVSLHCRLSMMIIDFLDPLGKSPQELLSPRGWTRKCCSSATWSAASTVRLRRARRAASVGCETLMRRQREPQNMNSPFDDIWWSIVPSLQSFFQAHGKRLPSKTWVDLPGYKTSASESTSHVSNWRARLRSVLELGNQFIPTCSSSRHCSGPMSSVLTVASTGMTSTSQSTCARRLDWSEVPPLPEGQPIRMQVQITTLVAQGDC